MDDPDLVRTDTPDLVQGTVIRFTVPDSDDELIADGQDRGDSLLNGVIQFGRVPHHRKAANRHGQLICSST
jgi:hypothetical protein